MKNCWRSRVTFTQMKFRRNDNELLGPVVPRAIAGKHHCYSNTVVEGHVQRQRRPAISRLTLAGYLEGITTL